MEACATWAVEALISSEGAVSANAWLERPGLLPTLAVQMQSCDMELLRAACFTYSKLAIQVRHFPAFPMIALLRPQQAATGVRHLTAFLMPAHR